MRLLRVGPSAEDDYAALEMREFVGRNVPPYAILSHTWSQDEITFQDISQGTYRARVAFIKLLHVMTEARKDGHKWVWIDTCCIDKSRSAELQEAINSMYTWYARAAICYVYLVDVSDEDGVATLGHGTEVDKEFLAARWFKRGWCLQELLAPRYLRFYGQNWQSLGDIKRPATNISQGPLLELISTAAHISCDVVQGFKDPRDVSVADRMSWAADRITTREEDIAYCLMGLFGVNMPLLYGEGTKAFTRLQVEIMRDNDDESILLWTDDRDVGPAQTGHFAGPLASSPSNFRHDQSVMCGVTAPTMLSKAPIPHEMTNKGLHIELRLRRVSEDVYLARLNCGFTSDYVPLGIYLKRLYPGLNQFVRIFSGKVSTGHWSEADDIVELLIQREYSYKFWLFHKDGREHTVPTLQIRVAQSTVENYILNSVIDQGRHANRSLAFSFCFGEAASLDTWESFQAAKFDIGKQHGPCVSFIVEHKTTKERILIWIKELDGQTLGFGAQTSSSDPVPVVRHEEQVLGTTYLVPPERPRYQISVNLVHISHLENDLAEADVSYNRKDGSDGLGVEKRHIITLSVIKPSLISGKPY